MQLRVTPIEGHRVPVLDAASLRPIHGRFLGYDAAGAFSPDPVLVPDCSDYRRAVTDHDLVLVEEVAS